MLNLKLGRRGKTNASTLGLKRSTGEILWMMMSKYVKCFSSIMKSQSSSRGGINGFTRLCKVNRRKCVHLLSTRRTSFIERPCDQLRWTSVIFSLCSMSGKSRRLNIQASNRSISNCRQFLIIYEVVISVVLVR